MLQFKKMSDFFYKIYLSNLINNHVKIHLTNHLSIMYLDSVIGYQLRITKIFSSNLKDFETFRSVQT